MLNIWFSKKREKIVYALFKNKKQPNLFTSEQTICMLTLRTIKLCIRLGKIQRKIMKNPIYTFLHFCKCVDKIRQQSIITVII